MKRNLSVLFVLMFTAVLFAQNADFSNQPPVNYTSDDPLTTAVWSTLPPSPHAVSRSCCALGKVGSTWYIYQFGGGSGAQFTNVARLNLTTNVWENNIAVIPAQMSAAGAVTIEDSLIYIFGGNSPTLGKGFKFNVSSYLFTALPDMPSPVTDAAVLRYSNNLIYVVGGGDGLFGTTVSNVVRLFNRSTNSWSTCTSLPTAKAMISGGIVKDTIIVSGGWSGSTGTNITYKGVINPGTPTTVTWTTLAPYPAGGVTRMGADVVSKGGGIGVVFSGGAIDGATPTNATNMWNFCTQSWQTLPPNTLARSNMRGCSLGDSVFYLIAGYTSVGVGNSDKLTFSQIDGSCNAIAPVACNYTWAAQTSGVTSYLQSVDAVNENIGWTAGNTAVVRRTTDGGTTWTNANPNPGVITGDIYNIEAIDANTAFVTTSPGATFIYRTTNGGTNWVQVYTAASPAFINAIEFINATTGYATGDPVGGIWELLITTNGGTNWTQMPSAPTQAGAEAGWNNSFSIVGTDMWFGTSNSRVYHSSNLGLNWSFGATTGMTNTYSVDYISALIGLASAPATPFMQKSIDGGATYTTVATLPAGTGTPFVSGYGTDFWAARGNTISRSTNNGDAWTTSFTGTGTYQHIDITAGTNGCPTGWAVTTTGGIAKMTGTVVGINGKISEIPSNFSLMQNYPNPFNPTTKITFALPQSSKVSLVIYDIVGREVETLVNDFKQAGTYSFDFNASNLASGVYLYKLTAGDFTETKKMLLVK